MPVVGPVVWDDRSMGVLMGAQIGMSGSHRQHSLRGLIKVREALWETMRSTRDR